MGQSAQEVQAASFPVFLQEKFQHLSFGDLSHFEIIPQFLSSTQNN